MEISLSTNISDIPDFKGYIYIAVSTYVCTPIKIEAVDHKHPCAWMLGCIYECT